jgi:hypothetical protein
MLFNCVQRCQSFVTVVASGCGPVVSPKRGKRLRSPPREQQPRTSHLMVDAGPCIAKCSILVSLPLCLKLENFIIYVSLLQLKNSCNNSVFGPCMCVLCVNASVLAPRIDPG